MAWQWYRTSRFVGFRPRAASRKLSIFLLVAGAAAMFLHSSSSAIEGAGPIRFREAGQPGGYPSAGLTFTLQNSPTARKHLPETMAGGVAAFDYDGDGLTDLFFTNGAEMPSLVKDGSRYWNRLFRNIGGMQFRDVTTQAGLQGAGYSIG